MISRRTKTRRDSTLIASLTGELSGGCIGDILACIASGIYREARVLVLVRSLRDRKKLKSLYSVLYWASFLVDIYEIADGNNINGGGDATASLKKNLIGSSSTAEIIFASNPRDRPLLLFICRTSER